jgi:hypothetical protein
MTKRQASRPARKQEVREECVDKDSKDEDEDEDEDERGMTTPWRGRIVVGLEQPLLLLSPCLIKLLRLGLYDGELLTKITLSPG